ncbi:MAG: diaminopimelate decarboxylase [Bacteroidia bacterium]|nr:diaminopimelate decarboxylase [Bacteroidia bacterium]
MLKTDRFERISRVETPFYYYDMPLFRRTLEILKDLAVKYAVKVHYAVKANSEERLLRMISDAGFGADAVSANEVERAIECGFDASGIMFAGVGKTDKEIRTALKTGIGCFNVESIPEMEAIDTIAASMGVMAPVAFRINPDIDPHTHKYITTGLEENKFGISSFGFDDAVAKLKECSHLSFEGLQFHIGSQITDVANVFSLESKCAREITEWFVSRGLKVSHVDFGGGLGVDYDEPDLNPVPQFETWLSSLRSAFPEGCGYELHIEPGRSLVAQCCSLITSVVFAKESETKTFLITDAGMNDLIRPALYGAYHKVENLSAYYERGEETGDIPYDVVGPICESSDVWGEGRLLPRSGRGDILAIRTAGAYGRTMASRYNLRDLAPAVYSDEI